MRRLHPLIFAKKHLHEAKRRRPRRLARRRQRPVLRGGLESGCGAGIRGAVSSVRTFFSLRILSLPRLVSSTGAEEHSDTKPATQGRGDGSDGPNLQRPREEQEMRRAPTNTRWSCRPWRPRGRTCTCLFGAPAPWRVFEHAAGVGARLGVDFHMQGLG